MGGAMITKLFFFSPDCNAWLNEKDNEIDLKKKLNDAALK